MNYVWMELCRQRNALARLMLGSLPREEPDARTLESPEEFAGQTAGLEQAVLEYGMGPMTDFPLAEPDWTQENWDWEGGGAVTPLRPAVRQSAGGWEGALRRSAFARWAARPGAVSAPAPAGVQPESGMMGLGDGGGTGVAGTMRPVSQSASAQDGYAAERLAAEQPAVRSRRLFSASGADMPQVRVVTELAETPARFSAADPAALSRAFERDARRYDGGFELYP